MSTLHLLSLRHRILKAGGWALAGYGVNQAIRLGSSLIMTRLLIPEMFGVMAIASVVLTILYMMSDLGISQNIVQSRRGEDQAFQDTAWVLQILRGLFLWIIAIVLSVVLAISVDLGLVPSTSVYAEPILPWIIATSSFSAVITGFQTTGVAIANRKLDQRILVRIQVSSQVVGLLLMVATALATRSIWALVLGSLVGPLTSVILGHSWLRHHRNRFRWDPSASRELIHFGKWTFVSSAFTVLSTNGDRLLLGAYVSTEYLGMYSIAVLLLQAFEGGVSGILGAVSLPALSEVARTTPSRLRAVYYKLRVPGDVLLLLAGGTLATSGSAIIGALYDPRYQGAGEILQVLAVSFFAARYNVSYHVYLALGRPKHLATINFVRCVTLLVGVPVAFSYGGIDAAVWAIALHGFTMIPLVLGLNHRLGVFDLRRELLVLPGFPIGMAMGLLCANILGTAPT